MNNYGLLEWDKCGHIWKDNRSWGTCSVNCPNCLDRGLNPEKIMINDISTEDLEKELKKREKLEKERVKPKAREDISIVPLREICQSYIDELDKKGYVEKDLKHYIFETALETFFGTKVWGWINEKLK